MTNSDGPSTVVPGRRRTRAEAPRTESVWVRLSPREAEVVQTAAARAGLSVGAWVGEVAVRQARAEAGAGERSEDSGWGPSSWRELVAALVALRAEVVAGHRVPVAQLDPALVGSGTSVGQPIACPDEHGGGDGGEGGDDGDGVVAVLGRIDAVTEAALSASVASAGRSRGGGARRGRRGSPGRLS